MAKHIWVKRAMVPIPVSLFFNFLKLQFELGDLLRMGKVERRGVIGSEELGTSMLEFDSVPRAFMGVKQK